MPTPGVLGNRLIWDDHNDFEGGFRVYRSTTTFDKDTLPAMLVELPANTTVYVDETAVEATEYFYMVSTFYGSTEIFASKTVSSTAAAGPLNIGEQFGGGRYIGNIVIPSGINEGTYAIIMAPDVADANLQWKTSQTSTANTNSLINGYDNTQAMIAAGIDLHPAAKHCVDYAGDGFTDWYLPSKAELNLAYTNRVLLGALNLNSSYYWSSSQYSSFHAWIQRMSDGFQATTSKTSFCRVRPVRRLKLMIQ